VPDIKPRLLLLLLLSVLICSAAAVANAQRVAVITPQNDGQIEEFSESVVAALSENFRVLDGSMSEAAFRSVTIENPFNLSVDEGRSISTVIGCDHLVLMRSSVQRRAVLSKPAYFEAYAVVFVIDGRTGRMIRFILESREAPTAADARSMLAAASANVSGLISKAIRERRPPTVRDPGFAEVPPPESPLAKGLRTPVPYRRIRPDYTDTASLYSIKATVDIEVDIDAQGNVARTTIERWAGFGLEESVEKAVRSMNWRPAERNGKPLPMRVLLRYNFTKIEKDEAY
jgi:TonB family protein